jgi:hypothetical protein
MMKALASVSAFCGFLLFLGIDSPPRVKFYD